MRKSLMLLSFIVALSASQISAEVIPPIGLAPGSPYELMFVTQGMTTGTSSNIADYNALVTTQAALAPAIPSTTWHAVVSTDSVDANVNAPITSGVPIYNTLGQEVVDGATDLYTATSLMNGVRTDQFGLESNIGLVWTGTMDSTGTASRPLGNSSGISVVGEEGATSHSGWVAIATEPQANLYPLYALSGELAAPTPEPGTLILLATGFVAISAFRVRRGYHEPRG